MQKYLFSPSYKFDEYKFMLYLEILDSIVKPKPETKSSQQQLSPAKDEVDKMDTETAPVENTDANGRNNALLRQIDDIEGQKIDIYIVSPDSPASSYINIISKKVGPDWKKLARELDFTNSAIKKISQNNSNDTDQQCVDMLDSHCKLKGKTFTKLALVEALFACGLRSVAETILNRDK
ncbi:hypothetical protein TrispH2_011791 [Trichoplax sp. H2]|uniref:Death domain-containing protein n=1 Tax=Trichoplax adhaerens TaxID=10228 RepID=B3SDX3_TRIAD|nr:hypothetical protein TRIADDRAFT_62477 [Trichoplax adhaerens]EDV19071.1 hypothetical protein TRIADDRAFT_62477 [Trichoplax adhaerens]RDD35954.1 hypothetical protein TrispH2_011791 [Trichoplax sp. H2]|eukprot:XP_002118442.1 hypothetical protein TRIADDRAFT_62477 [Trichoplax adhaerens]